MRTNAKSERYSENPTSNIAEECHGTFPDEREDRDFLTVFDFDLLEKLESISKLLFAFKLSFPQSRKHSGVGNLVASLRAESLRPSEKKRKIPDNWNDYVAALRQILNFEIGSSKA